MSLLESHLSHQETDLWMYVPGQKACAWPQLLWNLSNNILKQVKQISVLLENSIGAGGEGTKELP